MATHSRDTSTSPIPLALFVLLLAAGGGLFIAQTGPGLSLGASLLIVLLFLSFLHTELALHIILLSMLLSPEIVVGGFAGVSIGKPDVKGDVLVVRIEDLILTTVCLAWLARAAIFKDVGLVRKTPLNGPIVAYTVTLVVATLLGTFAGNVRPLRGFFFTLKYVEYFVVYFMAVNYIQDERQLRRLLGTAVATCAISAVMGIAQIPSGERVAAPFEGKYGEPNTFGGYLAFMLAVILGLALAAKTVPARLRWFALAALTVVPLLYTLSRTSWLATIPLLLTLILLSPRRLILMVGVGCVIILGSAVFPKQVLDRYDYTFHAPEARGDFSVGGARFDTSTSARVESWGYGMRGWVKRPLLGYGVTGFAFMDAQYVRVLTEAGLFGLAAFLWLLWRILRTAWNTYQRTVGTPFEGLALGYIAGFMAMITHCVGANTFIIVRIMEPFWFLTGIVTILPLLDPVGAVSLAERRRHAVPGLAARGQADARSGGHSPA
jgi:O-antigen ligase